MKRENASESKASEKPAVSASTGREGTAPPSAYDTFGGATINFHSTEFNHTDDLNDNSGNYRSFQPLDGIVTADMRHQMERRPNRDHVDSSADGAVALKKIEVKSDEPESVDALPPLTVISQGRILIVDMDAARAIACGEILSDQRLTCTLVVTNKASTDVSFSRLSRLALLEVDDVSITGAFGGFSAIVTVKGDQRHLTELLDNEAATFDLVLDLQPTPSFAGNRLPMGYYAPGPNPEDLTEAMAELPEMRGRFKKPQFTAFLKSRCVHGRSRTRDCRRCLEVCPFGAIQSADREISINHYLCQGCGGCALVCPADAIRMDQPSQEELLNLLRRALESREAGVAFPPTLVISDSGTAGSDRLLHRGDRNNDRIVNFEVEEIGYIGLEMILTALSYGADKVLVACGRQNPPDIRNAVAWQTQMAGAILKGLDIPEDKIRFVVIPPEDDDFGEGALKTDGLDMQSNNSPMLLWAFSPRHDRRALVRLAVQHLYDRSGKKRPWLPLPAGSPFGAVAVDAAACTLCMACAGACQSGALSASEDAPRLLFHESQCHQCGLCEAICPEHAIQLLPRILCDPDTVEAKVVLREAEPFRCIECKAPFASQAMVNRMKEKLRGHWMYADERQLRRLQMCRTCRTRDALTSQDMKSWNQL